MTKKGYSMHSIIGVQRIIVLLNLTYLFLCQVHYKWASESLDVKLFKPCSTRKDFEGETVQPFNCGGKRPIKMNQTPRSTYQISFIRFIKIQRKIPSAASAEQHMPWRCHGQQALHLLSFRQIQRPFRLFQWPQWPQWPGRKQQELLLATKDHQLTC